MANIKEAYTAVIDFNKTIITITSTVLAALISYLVFQDYNLLYQNLISPLVLLISLIFSFFGIGLAIPAINTDTSKIWAVRHSNIGASIMLIGILCIGFIQPKEKLSIDKVLLKIETSLKRVEPSLIQKNCKSFELIDDNYIIFYSQDSLHRRVVYSLDKDNIVSLQREKK